MGEISVQVDGRRRRSEHSRQQIVQAMLDLIGAGEVTPSAESVASAAGVGLRTVFRHFENMETLYQELNAAMAAELRPILDEPYSSPLWQGRVEEAIGRRVRIFERIMPFKIAADIHRHHSRFLSSQVDVMTREQRASLIGILPREIKANETLFNALELALSFESWRRLRKDQKLSVQKARATVEHLVRALLIGAA